MAPRLDRLHLARFIQAQRTLFAARHPRSAQLATQASRHFLTGVPMHWMRDWSTPFPLFVHRAHGVNIEDVDGHHYLDFCLGDSAALFGHSPPILSGMLAEQGSCGLSTMLPDPIGSEVGQLLQQHFGLSVWQLTSNASEANRNALRWARALTGRREILMFHGAYHGSVDDTMVAMEHGHAVPRRGQIGALNEASHHTRVVEFNDLDAVRHALSGHQIAAVLTEPALSNCGLVLPDEGYLVELQQLCHSHGTLLILDETHSLSAALGGYGMQQGVKPDLLVIGKAIAAGYPCAVLGMRSQIAHEAEAILASKEHGHSGMGTTLAGNRLALWALHATLTQLMHAEAYRLMEQRAGQIETGLTALLQRYQLPWCITRLGARCELLYRPTPPRRGSEALAALDAQLSEALHLGLLSHGILVSPFHNMLLCSPETDEEDVEQLLTAFDTLFQQLQLG